MDDDEADRIDHQLIDVFLDILGDDDIGGGANGEDIYASFSGRGRMFVVLQMLDGEVQNGGIDQWLRNPTGRYGDETLAAINAIGDHELGKIVGDAIEEHLQDKSANERGRRREFDKYDEQYDLHRLSFLKKWLAWWQSMPSDGASHG